MQYKIPVQIENEDPIFLGLSLRQLSIVMIGFGIAYSIFQSLAPSLWGEIALIPSWFIAALTLAIAVFKIHEMTFIPFLLSLVRLNIFPKERKWENTIDSFQAIDIGFLRSEDQKKENNVDLDSKASSLQDLQEKLKKL